MAAMRRPSRALRLPTTTQRGAGASALWLLGISLVCAVSEAAVDVAPEAPRVSSVESSSSSTPRPSLEHETESEFAAAEQEVAYQVDGPAGPAPPGLALAERAELLLAAQQQQRRLGQPQGASSPLGRGQADDVEDAERREEEEIRRKLMGADTTQTDTSTTGTSETTVASATDTSTTGASQTTVASATDTSTTGASQTTVASATDTSTTGASQTTVLVAVSSATDTSTTGASQTTVTATSTTATATSTTQGVGAESTAAPETSSVAEVTASESSKTTTTSTTRTSTTTTTTTTTNEVVVEIRGTMGVDVGGDVCEFVKSEDAVAGVRAGLAEQLEVPADYIDVALEATSGDCARRLSQQSEGRGSGSRALRGLSSSSVSSSVTVTYVITIPEDGPAEVQVTSSDVVAGLGNVTSEEFTGALNTAVATAAGPGTYVITVTQVSEVTTAMVTRTATSTTTTTTSTSTRLEKRSFSSASRRQAGSILTHVLLFTLAFAFLR